MNVSTILSHLKSERDRIDAAITALESIGPQRGSHGSGRGRRAVNGAHKGRRMSAVARKRMSEARRKWWAERRKAAGR